MINKHTDIETNISPTNIDIGDIGCRFYTEDENTAFIRINIKYDGQPVDLTDNEEMKPKLDLFMQDGSIFIDEPLEILIPESGSIQYNITNKVIKHAGKVNCKLFLDNGTESVHVANFSFTIFDSGVEKAVGKEVSINLVKNTVKQIISEDLTNVLDDGFKDKLTKDLQIYLATNKTDFKGDKGDTPTFVDSGWIPIQLINGASNYNEDINASYKIINFGNLKIVTLQGYISVKESKIVAMFPKEISPKTKIKIGNFNLDVDGTLSSDRTLTTLILSTSTYTT
ncbi:tail fiber [Xanthomonas phage SU1]